MAAEKINIDIDSVNELVYELKGQTKQGATTKHDDGSDCLANFLDPDFVIIPTGQGASEYSRDEYDDYTDYDEADKYDIW